MGRPGMAIPDRRQRLLWAEPGRAGPWMWVSRERDSDVTYGHFLIITSGRIQPMPSEGRQSWHYDTLSSLHLQPEPFTTLDDYCHGPDGAAGAWAPQQHPPGPQDIPGRMEQRTD